MACLYAHRAEKAMRFVLNPEYNFMNYTLEPLFTVFCDIVNKWFDMDDKM